MKFEKKLTPTQKGKIYGLIIGGVAIAILYFFVPTNEQGKRLVLITYGMTIVMSLISAMLWIYHLIYPHAMLNSKWDNFVYTFTGALFFFSIVEAIWEGRLPEP